MLCDYILYYDTQIDVDRCREAHNMWKKHRVQFENLVWVKDLRDDPETRLKYPDAPLPILTMVAMPSVGWFGDEALAKLQELYSITPGVPEPVILPPDLTPPSRVKARYVLYTNDVSSEIKVPANGVVHVQSYDLVSTTIGDKMPKWLREYRALPVLATLEPKPTVWYGHAARDYCVMLCTYNSGVMLI